MASWLSCRGWYMEDASLDEVKKIMEVAEDETLDKTLRFTALYVAMTSDKISWGKFEEVCLNLDLLGDISNNLDKLKELFRSLD